MSKVNLKSNYVKSTTDLCKNLIKQRILIITTTNNVIILVQLAILTLILSMHEGISRCDAVILKCPVFQMHLQKIIGVRPPFEYIGEYNLMYMPRPLNYKDRDRDSDRDRNRREGYFYDDTTTNEPPNDHTNDQRMNKSNKNNTFMHQAMQTPSSICWHMCDDDPDCIAYVHLLDTNECYGYTYFERAQRYLTIENGLPLVADPEAIFYEKTCLKVPETCRNRLWTLTKIPGNSLIFQGKKTLSTLVTRRECAERCFFETEFPCLSASFAPSYRNIRDRYNEFSSTPPSRQAHLTLGRCVLSDKDKMVRPDAFRAAPYDEEYMENQCNERPIENDNCSYEFYANSSFIYAEAKYVGLTQKECQSHCSNEMRFYCQGVSYYYDRQLMNSECYLHSEDIVSMGPRSLKIRENSVYMRRVKCLDVQVVCTKDEMVIKYNPKEWFGGLMYANHHLKDCSVEGKGSESTFLHLNIGSEVKEKRCGILRAYEVTKEYQRTFVSALIVVQNNIQVESQGDRLIKVGCIMSNTSMLSHDSQVNQNEVEENVPSAVALESSLEFSQHVLPSAGSAFYNISSDVTLNLLPKITLQIMDISHQHETDDVHIGQNLELQIIAEYPLTQRLPESMQQMPPLPDFHATNLVAKSVDTQARIQLIDENGCATDATVFPPLERSKTSSKNMLTSRFHAFKFAGSSMVSFDVNIHFCQTGDQRCSSDNCWQYGSNGKQVRVQNPIYISTVMDVNANRSAEQQSNNETFVFASDLGIDNHINLQRGSSGMPLNYNLHVRGPDTANSNSVIYGQHGYLLIAGVDDQLHLDNICLNQSLLIALFIFWLIFQVALLFGCCYVLQKYKHLAAIEEERRKAQENLEYWENRHVHWADQSGYTL